MKLKMLQIQYYFLIKNMQIYEKPVKKKKMIYLNVFLFIMDSADIIYFSKISEVRIIIES